MSKVNSIPLTLYLNSIKGRASGQGEKMTDLTSSNKNKTASWTASHTYRNKAIKFLQLQEWLLAQEDTFLVNREH